MAILFTKLQTPAAALVIQSTPAPPGLKGLAATVTTSWVDRKWMAPPSWELDRQLLPETTRLLEAYFHGEDVDPAVCPIPTPKGSAFQHRCWQALRRVERGQRVTYSQLARLAGGNRRHARAVGAAMRANPLPVIVPCHRVVAQDGHKQRLGGYMGASQRHAWDDPRLEIKRWLLDLEVDIVRTVLVTEERSCV